MVVKKLGFFTKMLGKLGKRLIFNMSQKINLYTCAIIVQETMRVFKDIYGDWEIGLEEFNEALTTGVREMVADMMDEKILFGKGLADIVSMTPSDSISAVEIGFWALMGSESRKLIGKPVWYSADQTEDNIPKLVVEIKTCPFCCGMENIEGELKNIHFGDFFAAMIGGILQEMMDYVGNEFNIVNKETKCFMRGDDKGELTFYFYPREK
ncbi:MAG: hypothetical protein ACTSPY_00085 [Candidatus Helarchaeota archaeon]